jgi:hypothetical protein
VDEKKAIEKATAEGFLKLFNEHFRTDFAIVNHFDAPDVRCRDSRSNELNLEITLTEDQALDIQAILGRSNHKSIEALKLHNERIAQGKERPHFSALLGNVLDHAAKRINEKLLKSYGSNVALVVRDSSLLDWEWDSVIDDLKAKLNLARNPFDKGIWILNMSKTKLYQVIEGFA